MEEVRGLMDSGLPENAKPFDFIGYRELREVLRGEKKLKRRVRRFSWPRGVTQNAS